MELPGERYNARTMPGAPCTQASKTTDWMDNIKTWTGFFVEDLFRMTEERDKWRKYVMRV